MNWTTLKPVDLNKIQVVDYPEDKYFKEEYPKKQIVLHHTVSGKGIDGDLNTWKAMKGNIGTCVIIDRDGVIWQLFSSKYWAYHLKAGSSDLDKHSIAIELDSWGYFEEGDGTEMVFGKKNNGTPKTIKTIPGKFYTAYGTTVDVPMTYYPSGFRGHKYFESYTTAQIQATGELLLHWKNKYGIPLTYKSEMWDVSQDALGGKPGVWSHCSYRKPSEKSDAHPQPELIDMLKAISNL